MFNTQQHEEAMAAAVAAVEADPDKSWLQTVNLRYGEFLAGQARRQLDAVIRGLAAGPASAELEQAFRDYYANELMAACSTCHGASALVRGAVIVPNPVQCEAVMRLHKAANAPAEA